MGFKTAAYLLLALAPGLAACASASSEYPSLALREAERASGTFEPVAPEPYVAPPTPAAVLSRLDQLAAEAANAHQAFLADVPATRSAVGAASGDAIGSEAWARAEVALAALASRRSQAMIALADLDRLYVDAAVAGESLDRIGAVRDRVAAQVEQQDDTIEALGGSLP